MKTVRCAACAIERARTWQRIKRKRPDSWYGSVTREWNSTALERDGAQARADQLGDKTQHPWAGRANGGCWLMLPPLYSTAPRHCHTDRRRRKGVEAWGRPPCPQRWPLWTVVARRAALASHFDRPRWPGLRLRLTADCGVRTTAAAAAAVPALALFGTAMTPWPNRNRDRPRAGHGHHQVSGHG